MARQCGWTASLPQPATLLPPTSRRARIPSSSSSTQTSCPTPSASNHPTQPSWRIESGTKGRNRGVRCIRSVGHLFSHTQCEKKLSSKATSKMISATMVGQIKSQKITNHTLERGGRILKTAPHLLHRTLLRRPAFRNNTARIPPAKNTGQLNEPLNSTVGV